MVGLAGLTRRFSSNIVAGLLGGYERFNFTSDALTGRLKGEGWTAGGYLGWRFGSIRASFGVTHSWIGYDGVAGLAAGTFKGDRWLMSGGLTGAYGMSGLMLEPSVRVYAMWENEKGYTDSLGIAQEARTFFTGRASAGNKVSYPVGAMAGTVIAPYVGAYADYYFSHDDAAFSGLASTPVLSGWSAASLVALPCEATMAHSSISAVNTAVSAVTPRSGLGAHAGNCRSDSAGSSKHLLSINLADVVTSAVRSFGAGLTFPGRVEPDL